MPDIVLEARGLHKKFRKGELYTSLRDLVPALARRAVKGDLGKSEFWALRDVNFQVARGEAFGIIGHNGAGKSTLLKHLCGILVPTSGQLIVKGRLSALIEVGAGFHPDLTGRDNIYLNGTILGMTRAEIRSKFDAIVEFSELADFLDTPVKRYSSGMYARLGFAVAAHVEPDVLVVDEVLSVGDFVFQKKSVEKMRQVMASGTTVVFVSHNLRAVADLCQRGMLLDHGTVSAIGPVTEVIKTYMERGTAGAGSDPDKDVYVSRVTLRGEAGAEAGAEAGNEAVQFDAGERMIAEVEVTARRPAERLAVVIECRDEEMYEVFNTSTQRLGAATVNLAAGEKFTARFALRLHLAPGTYHFGVYVYRYDIQKNYDTLTPAKTFYVRSLIDVRGVAHLEPEVLGQDKS
ncbi:MAG TPA: ABC transporter ATP-binding protein [Kofleriaceae bacterium]|jgi:lipopolysaccharide transport system ATP-binding protein|nr:ABC transporter ATP-binding protein [Kofleriaceae bacterium]